MNYIVFVGEQPKTFEIRWHAHETWELVYCVSGQGAFRFRDGRVLSYRAGELVAIPPNEAHANSSDVGFSNIHLNLSEFSYADGAAFRMQDQNGSLHRAFLEAKTYYTSDLNKKELLLSALGELIVSYVIAFRSNAEFPEMVERIRNEILQNYTDPDFELESFIHSMPFHYDYLRKRFKQETGQSPLEYLTALRMEQAGKLMAQRRETGCTVAQIARLCGYEDALYFSRVFKKHYGCTPTAFSRNKE